MTLQTFRDLRNQIPSHFQREELAHLSLPLSTSFKDVIVLALAIGLGSWLVLWAVLDFLNVTHPAAKAAYAANFIFLSFLIWPFVSLLFLKKPDNSRSSLTNWRHYSFAQQAIACLVLSFFIVNSLRFLSFKFLDNTQPYPIKQNKEKKDLKSTKPLPFRSQKQRDPESLNKQLVKFGVFSASLYFLMLYVSRPSQKKRRKKSNITADSPHNPPFRLWLGESTGRLANLWHPSNLSPQQQIGLNLPDATQNILILGAIGSGKTTRAMHPLLLQLLDQDCGGLIFDIKGDFKEAVTSLAHKVKRETGKKEPIRIGVHQEPFNLLAGLSPEIASSFLKSAFLLSGTTTIESFWVDTATELCRNVLGLLSFFPEHYHLNSLYLYLFDPTFQHQTDEQVSALPLNASQKRLLTVYTHYLHTIFRAFDDKIKSGILANVAQILSPFQHPELVDSFCDQKTKGPQMEDVLEGEVYVVDMPLAQWGLAAKLIYTLLKLRFFNVMQQRSLHPSQNQSRPIFFMCDEYQEIVSCNKDGLSDLNFWDKSRTSQTIGIISAQSISSFYAAVGDQNLVHALLQNFRQKLIFRVEDESTVTLLSRLLGQVETQKVLHSAHQSHHDQSRSSSQSLSYQQKEVVNGELFRTLNPNQALALLSLNGNAADDVLTLKQMLL